MFILWCDAILVLVYWRIENYACLTSRFSTHIYIVIWCNRAVLIPICWPDHLVYRTRKTTGQNMQKINPMLGWCWEGCLRTSQAVFWWHLPHYTLRTQYDGIMLVKRCRRLASIMPPLVQRLVFAGMTGSRNTPSTLPEYLAIIMTSVGTSQSTRSLDLIPANTILSKHEALNKCCCNVGWHQYWLNPSKNETLTQCWANVGAKLAQYCRVFAGSSRLWPQGGAPVAVVKAACW